MWPTVGFGDAEIGEQERRGLGSCRVNWPGGAGCLAVASLNSAVNTVALSLCSRALCVAIKWFDLEISMALRNE